MKFVNQLNALIINGDNDRFYFEKVHVQPLPLYQAIVDVHIEKKKYQKIAWPNYEVNLIKPGKIFSKCLQTNTNHVLKIKNEFLYKNKEKLYCLDDYVDNFIEVEKGDVVKLIGVYGIYAYVIKDNNVGWIKFRYLKKHK